MEQRGIRDYLHKKAQLGHTTTSGINARCYGTVDAAKLDACSIPGNSLCRTGTGAISIASEENSSVRCDVRSAEDSDGKELQESLHFDGIRIRLSYYSKIISFIFVDSRMMSSYQIGLTKGVSLCISVCLWEAVICLFQIL